MIVAIQLVAAERRDVDVLPAVAVDVGSADAHAPAWVADARFVGDVLELATAAIPIQRAARGAGILCRITVSESTK